MNRKILLSCLLTLLAACWLGSCSKDDDEEPAPAPVVKHGATMQIMIVFSPGQLGDDGYADRVFGGIKLIELIDEMFGADTIDVNFISTYNRAATCEAMKSWAQKPVNPFYGKNYERRLLVLTEPFMIHWLDEIKDTLRQTDDVLVLKTSKHLMDSVAASTGIGERLYGLNISAADATRRFCKMMDIMIEMQEDYEGALQPVNREVLPIFRLYPDSEVDYQDSIYTVLREELGDETMLEVSALSSDSGEGLYGRDSISATTLAFTMAENMERYYTDFHYGFAITDLGAADTGWNYYVFGHKSLAFLTLQLDARDGMTSQYIIDRRFDTALSAWVLTWMLKTSELPRVTWGGVWNNLCQDNLPSWETLNRYEEQLDKEEDGEEEETDSTDETED